MLFRIFSCFGKQCKFPVNFSRGVFDREQMEGATSGEVCGAAEFWDEDDDLHRPGDG